jgi:probable rRNA maturation factor
MVTIQVKRNVKLPVNKSILLNAARTTLKLAGTSGGPDVGIVVGNDALLHQLNVKYRQVDGPTDVLSFPAGEVDPDTSDVYLGDVVISLPRAEDQAAAGGHPVSEELQLLVVHGVLHLLGYDHEGFNDKQKMQAAQDRILQQLGLQVNGTL